MDYVVVEFFDGRSFSLVLLHSVHYSVRGSDGFVRENVPDSTVLIKKNQIKSNDCIKDKNKVNQFFPLIKHTNKKKKKFSQAYK